MTAVPRHRHSGPRAGIQGWGAWTPPFAGVTEGVLRPVFVAMSCEGIGMACCVGSDVTASLHGNDGEGRRKVFSG